MISTYAQPHILQIREARRTKTIRRDKRGRARRARITVSRQQGRKVPAPKSCELGRLSGPEETRTALA